ncbi:MAG: glycosyltransferase, partial [Paracoccaceae bacterium]
AVAALASEIPDLHLWIFGEGPERENLAALIAQLGLEGRAVLKGTTPQLMQEMAAAQVLAVGSRREGFGNVVVEGLAAGTQVVATTCPGPRAILANGQLGRLVPPDDVAAMTGALRAALTTPVDPTLSNRVGAAIAAYSVPGAVSDFEMQCLDLLARTANRGTVPA